MARSRRRLRWTAARAASVRVRCSASLRFRVDHSGRLAAAGSCSAASRAASTRPRCGACAHRRSSAALRLESSGGVPKWSCLSDRTNPTTVSRQVRVCRPPGPAQRARCTCACSTFVRCTLSWRLAVCRTVGVWYSGQPGLRADWPRCLVRGARGSSRRRERHPPYSAENETVTW